MPYYLNRSSACWNASGCGVGCGAAYQFGASAMLSGAMRGIVGAAVVAPLITSSGGACGANANGSMMPGVAAVFCTGCVTGETCDRPCCCCCTIGSCGCVGEALTVRGAIVGYATVAERAPGWLVETDAKGSSAMSGMSHLLCECAHADSARPTELNARPIRPRIRQEL